MQARKGKIFIMLQKFSILDKCYSETSYSSKNPDFINISTKKNFQHWL